MNEILKELLDQTARFVPRVAVGILVFVLFWFTAVVLQKILHRVGEKSDFNRDVIRLMGRVLRATVLVFGVITALGTMGINVSALVAGLGLTGFALGFALKDVLSNLLAGTLILIYRPFKCNDYIMVAGFEGRVVEIDLRYTTLKSNDKKILIPNSTLFTNAIRVQETEE